MGPLGIYGGTFNPPHLGHIRAAEYAAQSLGLDKILMIPSFISPHKVLPDGSATAAQRLEMLEIAVQGSPRLQVCDLELRRGGTSYTYQTVEQLAEENPGRELILFMGTDMFLSFLSWREPERILKKAALGVFYRGERGEQDAIDACKAKMEQLGAQIYLVQNDVTAISSTDLRRMLVFDCADAYLPAGVGEYIRKAGLYLTGQPKRALPMDALERTVTALLKPSRVAHVLGCRDTAVELARLWGADETDAARAGLLHDVTKALDGPLQLALCQAYGVCLDAFSVQNPKTLHAWTGSLVAERIFGENKAVIDAIFSHTTGKAHMNTLEKIIYVADYMEPNRDFPGVQRLRELAFLDLDAALKLGLEMTVAMLREQGRSVSPASLRALEWLNEK